MSLVTQTITDNEYEILRFQKDVGTEVIKNMKDILQSSGINFTGDLSNSFQLVMINGKASVETQNAYASFVDKGISGGSVVNFDALKDWVRIKIGLEEPDLTPVTWAILNKIQNEGIRPTRFVKKALKAFISSHGVASIRRTGKSGKGGSKLGKRIMKAVKKLNKGIKKINKTLRTASKNINKVYKPIRRYK